ncbi:U6 snRNA-associated Sm-like protein LSm1 [Aspergillus undulatus]|uniref:U6 snRNA-associated Sm-like protein LSm1 n=1 Tax=Aspergillus undulatus TaxID=1810928 RepID=UPI003CCD3436
MERLPINDPAGPGQQGKPPQGFPPERSLGPSAPMTHGPPQLPPQMFTTAAQLLDLTDSASPWPLTHVIGADTPLEKLVLVLRDGRKLIGVLRTWDQFANLVLQETIERLYAGNLYTDIPRGVFLVRGENVLLLGEIDLDKEDDMPPNLIKASFKEVYELKKKEDTERKAHDKKSHNKLQGLGFEPEHSGEILF